MGSETPEALALEESLAALKAQQEAGKEKTPESAPEVKTEPGDFEAEVNAELAKTAKPAEPETKKAEEPAEEIQEELKPGKKQRNPEVDAIVALRRQGQMLAEELAVMRGQNEALSKMLQMREQTPVRNEPVKDRLAEIEEQKLELAAKADTADITLVELLRETSKLDREAFELMLKRNQPAPVQPPQPPVMQEDLYLAEQTRLLVEKYPFVNDLTQEDLEPCKALAYREAVAEGNPIQPGALGTLELRTRMLEIAARVYKLDANEPKAGTDNSAKAAAMAKKVDLQESLPPNVAKIGNAGDSQGLTAADYNAKLNDPNTSFAEAEKLIASMPPALKKKLGLIR